VSDLLRPEPPPDWRARLGGALADVRPARVVAGVVTVAVTVLAATWLLRAPAPPVEALLPPARPLAAPASSAVPLPTTTTASVVVVQAAGAVAQPGVYRLPVGARVADVIAAAGGVTADADPAAVLLAALVVDGERVYVPRVGEVPPAVVAAPTPAGSGSAGTTPSGPVNLNTATADDLDELPGVGPATAAAIVAHRDAAGAYASVDQLLDVKGIGPAKLEALRPLVTV
jgi:competence protein ComEA